MQEQINNIMTTLSFIKEDNSVPKNIRSKIDETINSFNIKGDVSLKISKVLQELDEISNDPNLPIYTRIEILNIIGILGSYQ